MSSQHPKVPPPPSRSCIEDYAGWTDRELLVAARESANAAELKAGGLEQRQDALEIHVEGLDDRVSKLETVSGRRRRNPDDSLHEYDEDIEEFRLIARAQAKDPRLSNITPARVKSIFARAKRELQEEGELNTYRRAKTLLVKVAWEAGKVAIPSALGAIAYHLWHLLHQ